MSNISVPSKNMRATIILDKHIRKQLETYCKIQRRNIKNTIEMALEKFFREENSN